ncbi:hypothetical protein D3C75_767200 [compost metagenome]
MVLRLGGESHATRAPDGAADGTGTGTARTFLAPRLLATTTNFGAGLLRAGALTTTCHVGNDSLVYQGLVELITKGALGDFDRLRTVHIQLHLSNLP